MSQDGQNPSITLSTIHTKLNNNQIVSKNKSPKKSKKSKNKYNFISSTNNNNDDEEFNKGPKVVHISNPMKFQVNPCEFRALVQELTGRDAAEWPDYYYINNNNNNNSHNNNDDHNKMNKGVSGVDVDANHDDLQVDYSGSSDLSIDYFGPFDSDNIYGGVENESHLLMEDIQAFMGDGNNIYNNYTTATNNNKNNNL